MPKVSVIIPTYNRSDLLKLAISSVLSQSYTDYEIIVVDDGSTDNTRKVVESFNAEAIRYVYQNNMGRSAARNAGISSAKGQYIAFLDSDDIFLPSKLELQVKCLDSNPLCGLVYSYASNVDENGNSLAYHYDGDLSGSVYPDMLYIRNNFITTPTVMVRANILSETGGFDESMHMCEDLDLWRRIARNHQVMQIRQSLAQVRIRTDEKIDVLEFMAARTRYYNKAIDEDVSLRNIKRDLYNEMYVVYSGCALSQKKYMIIIWITLKSLFNDPVRFIQTMLKSIKAIFQI